MTPDDRPNRKDGLGRYPPHLNPDNVPVKPPRWEIWAVVLIVATLSALLTAGATQWFEHRSSSETSQLQNDIKLVGASQQLAVIVVSAEERREIKLLDAQSLRVQDVTRGQTTALAAALSPDGENLAYVSDSPDGAMVSAVEVKGGEPLPLTASAVLRAGEDTGFSHLVVCRWTDISWSTDSSRFLIFGCEKNKSAIIVVSVGQALAPVVLADTCATQEGPREAIWLNDCEVLFSQRNDATGQASLKTISADDRGSPLLIYGE
jgi:hypothetical protein